MRQQPTGKLRWLAALALVLVCAAALFLLWRGGSSQFVRSSDVTGAASRELVAQLVALEAQEKQVDETVWAKERLAEQCGQVFESLWDALNLTTNKLAALASFPVGEVIPGKLNSRQTLAH